VSPRLADLDDFYKEIDRLRARVGGPRLLGDPKARAGLPQSGVYLFFEHGEVREDGLTPRVVRVGTHGLTESSKATLPKRLAQHCGTFKGKRAGGGDYRASIFRKHVGHALLAKHPNHWHIPRKTWGAGSSAKPPIKDAEHCLELEVSAIIRRMPFLWVAVDGPGSHEARDKLERRLIALLSNFEVEPVDPPSAGWLGHHSTRPKIRGSGLWNSDHVDVHNYDEVIDGFKKAVSGTPTPEA